MAFWDSLLNVVVLLATAWLLGALCERFRQSAILGYLLAGILLKMGTYGILRLCYPVFPLATQDYAFICLAALGTWNIIYGALCALAQTDMKKLVAYSSISHMGYVMLGMATLTSQGINLSLIHI